MFHSRTRRVTCLARGGEDMAQPRNGGGPAEEDCFFCRRRVGREPGPEGGFLYEGEHFLVGHGFLGTDEAGSLLVEARRHVLDPGDMTDEEMAALTALLPRLYRVLHQALGADRVYLLSTQARNPHFHAYLHPWRASEEKRGVPVLAPGRPRSAGGDRAAAPAPSRRVAQTSTPRS